MSNADIQRELLMETLTLIKVLQFALHRERGLKNQRAINTQLNPRPIPHSTKYPTSKEINHQHKHIVNAYPFGTHNNNVTSPPQTHADALGKSSPQNTYKYARQRKYNATYAKRSDTTVKYVVQPNTFGRPNKLPHNKIKHKPEGKEMFEKLQTLPFPNRTKTTNQ